MGLADEAAATDLGELAIELGKLRVQCAAFGVVFAQSSVGAQRASLEEFQVLYVRGVLALYQGDFEQATEHYKQKPGICAG